MSFPSSSQPSLSTALTNVQGYASGVKLQATAAVAFMAANSITTDYVFSVLDRLAGVILTFQTYQNVTGLNAYATANIPGYAGTLTTDITAVISAAQAAIAWVTTNFPKDNTNTYVLAYKLNADGTRTPASFTSVQTAGFQTALNALVATIN